MHDVPRRTAKPATDIEDLCLGRNIQLRQQGIRRLDPAGVKFIDWFQFIDW